MARVIQPVRPPNQLGRGLVNLVAEFEHRIAGAATSPTLDDDLASLVPEAESVVFVLFDGLGSHQLAHAAAGALRAASAASLDAPFPTTTTVSLATIATGVHPGRHGILAYALHVPELGTVLNTIHMRTVWAQDVDIDLANFLPVESLWARLTRAGCEPVTVQPANFASSALTEVLYGETRFEAYYSAADIAEVTVDIASHPGRFVFVYVPFVDLAAHLHGQASTEYADAVRGANLVWERLCAMLPDTVALIGTADHGHIDIPARYRARLTAPEEKELLLAGDSRALFVTGDPTPVLDRVPASWIPLDDLDGFFGPDVDTRFAGRLPDGIVFPDDGWAIFARYMNNRLIGYHGGLSAEEREIPLLVRR